MCACVNVYVSASACILTWPKSRAHDDIIPFSLPLKNNDVIMCSCLNECMSILP